ncbi:MAG: hypothetical protein QE264_00595 [Flavobacterium sp.]|nr:hypothetical protein [Flavobacterium sp.]
MEDSKSIFLKLEAFIKKYYTNELIRGLLFFIGLGLMYFLFTLFIEYFLWLKPMGRTILFVLFVLVEGLLLVRFVAFPIFKLFKLQKGINFEEASAIIGTHFTEVSDKLINFLQLTDTNSQEKSELLLASIEQKAKLLSPIPFSNAINFNVNKKYLPLVILPILFFLFFYVSGNSYVISQSFERVVNFKKQFLPPAPFKFVVLNKELQTEQNKDFVIKVKSEGKIIPETVMINIGSESYFMESNGRGEFQYKIEKPNSNVSFFMEANTVSSFDYELNVVTVPAITNIEMTLNFPSYLNKKAEIIKGTGNAIIPEGTTVTWKMNTVATQSVNWTNTKSNFSFFKQENVFKLSKNISQNTEYTIITSNNKVKDYERLSYQISVIKDQFPTINVNNAPDSLKVSNNYVLGQVSDDYGLSKLQIVYYEKDKPQSQKKAFISVKKDVYDQFVFAFPSNLPVEQGIAYEYYLEVFDNDALHNFKSSKSAVFYNRIATDQEKEEQILQEQNNNINSLEKSLKNQDKQILEIEKLQKSGKEKESLEFKDQQKVNDFIKRQKQQDEIMKEYSKKMEENLEKFKTDKKDEFKEELQKRLENADKELEKNKKLLDELKELNDKIKSEELFEKLDKFKQITKDQTKTLEQLVELTKKYYVEKKAEQIADNLNKLADKQDKLAESEKENQVEKQEAINKEFDKIQEDLKDLVKENKELKSPIDLPKDAEKENSINEDLKKAKDELQKKNQSKAKPKQKSASKKMKEMSGDMTEGMAEEEMDQLEEDVKMLRQILDNLLAYSFSQEDLMKQFKGFKRGSPAFNKDLKIQQNLKQQFKHVDDSLFAMSLRNPKIAENVTKEIGNVHYNIDKALNSFVASQITKGLSHQQYAISASNKLADFLSDALNNMQSEMKMSGSGKGGKPKPGKGQGSGMQLPDIIKKQEGLGEKMKEGMKKGNKPGKGTKPGEGEKGKSKGEGKSGNGTKQSGENGEDGENGENGEDGEGNAGEIMKIYQEQKQLREALENALNKEGMGGNGKNAVEQMKQIEKQLLNKGFNNETLQKILNLQYELLKLEKATQQQGEEKKRQSQTNQKEFNNQSKPLPSNLQEYLNSIEILNRQSLPLRSNFNQKVQEYFKNND